MTAFIANRLENVWDSRLKAAHLSQNQFLLQSPLPGGPTQPYPTAI
jgi:hypothetical protein